jgi:F420-dependent oxidoreductase-like protein
VLGAPLGQAGGMDLRIMTEPQFGATYEEQLTLAQAAETAGFDAYFRSDHYLAMGSSSGLPGPTDSWVTLGALARETSRIRLGTMVSSATFRLPGPLAISVAQVDQMSGGRVELGLGTGWFEAEHTAYGIPFPPVGERFDRLEEQLEIITGLFGTPVGSRFSFAGKHYTVTDSPALPKPVQSPLPLIVGGSGPKRTPALAARFAAEYNTVFVDPQEAGARFRVVGQACEAAGRETGPVYSVMVPVAVGERASDVADRAAVYGTDPETMVGVVGSPQQALDTIGRYREAGAQRVYLQVLDLADLDHVALIGAEVIPHL